MVLILLLLLLLHALLHCVVISLHACISSSILYSLIEHKLAGHAFIAPDIYTHYILYH
ncbi:hypothetical protein BDZ91DRAFT_713958 [Kalaharituber pfeilii]|nr:hypothetical protein BDZ91DRAFT_713958 [Kalaharituber pfeilii]